MSRASNLFRLQTIDAELDLHRARLQSIDQALGDSPLTRAAQEQVHATQARLQTARLQARTLEQDSQALGDKIGETEKRLYGGSVTNPKELRELQQEQGLLQQHRAQVEEHQLDAMIAADAAETEWQAAQTALRNAEETTQQNQGQLGEERARLQTRVAQLEDEREALRPAIPAADLQIYQHLRQSKNQRAVVLLADEICTACGVAPSAARVQDVRRGGELIRCGNCDRILYAQ